MSNTGNIKWKRSKFFIEAKVRVPVLGALIEISAQPEDDAAKSPSPSQLRAVAAFLKLSPKRKEDWTHQVALECHSTCTRLKVDGFDEPVHLRKREDVWKHVRLRQIFIPQHGRSRDRYLFVQGGCDWDEEHGLELLFKNEQLYRVGPEDGLALNEAWSLYYINE